MWMWNYIDTIKKKKRNTWMDPTAIKRKQLITKIRIMNKFWKLNNTLKWWEKVDCKANNIKMLHILKGNCFTYIWVTRKKRTPSMLNTFHWNQNQIMLIWCFMTSGLLHVKEDLHTWEVSIWWQSANHLP